MSGTWDGTSEAVPSIGGHELSVANGESIAAPVNMTSDEDAKRAHDAGWTEKIPYDYDAFTRTGGADNTFLGAGAVYEWKDEYGEVAPEIAELEKILFGSEHALREGQHREALEIEVNVEGPQKVAPIFKFKDAGLHPVVERNIELCRYVNPTPIQSYTIPAIREGLDVVGIAQTGSGKTAAYLIPILSKLMGKAKKLAAPRPDSTAPGYNSKLHRVRAEPLVVIVVPTRELAVQIFDEARRMCYRSMLRPCVAYGGLPYGICMEELGKGCDILIGTPGRLKDLMDKPDILTMCRIKFTVIDEADEMLDQDWSEELNTIMAGGDTNEDADHTYFMFSATFPKAARAMAREYMSQDYVRIRVGRPGQAHKNIKQEVLYVDNDQKRHAVYDLLFASDPARTLIFCNSKPAVDLLDDFLYNKGLPTTSIHGDRNQREREDAIRAFRTGKAPILIATGISARGWDVAGVKHVINYDLPSTMYTGISEYIHRIGRTARIGNKGLATSFYNERNEDIAQDLVNVLVECEQDVPEFLEHLKPAEGTAIAFDDDSGDEAEAGGGDVAWGGDGGATIASAEVAAESGFTVDDSFKSDASKPNSGFQADDGAW